MAARTMMGPNWRADRRGGRVPRWRVGRSKDIGPCRGDGLDVVADGITLNLNGHAITGRNATNTSVDEHVGVNLMNNNSSFNRITGNTMNHNGPFSGISMVGRSASNVVANNRSVENSVSNVLPAGTAAGHADGSIRTSASGWKGQEPSTIWLSTM